MKDSEFQAMGLDLVVGKTGSHHRWLLLHFHVKYGANRTVPEHLSRLEANTHPPDVTQGFMNSFFLLSWQGGNRGMESRSRGKTDEIKETL